MVVLCGLLFEGCCIRAIKRQLGSGSASSRRKAQLVAKYYIRISSRSLMYVVGLFSREKQNKKPIIICMFNASYFLQLCSWPLSIEALSRQFHVNLRAWHGVATGTLVRAWEPRRIDVKPPNLEATKVGLGGVDKSIVTYRSTLIGRSIAFSSVEITTNKLNIQRYPGIFGLRIIKTAF